jgi:hypothetical protein
LEVADAVTSPAAGLHNNPNLLTKARLGPCFAPQPAPVASPGQTFNQSAAEMSFFVPPSI